jgi:arsenite methyltransferase
MVMKKLEVFDPPMCCSTGVCGPKVDPVLVRFSADLHWLVNQGIAVERYNLSQQPQAFAANAAVKAALSEHGNTCLPLILLDGAAVSRGSYPTRQELARMAGVEPPSEAGIRLPVIETKCC